MYKSPPSARSSIAQQQDIYPRDRGDNLNSMTTTLSYATQSQHSTGVNTSLPYNSNLTSLPTGPFTGATDKPALTVRHQPSRGDFEAPNAAQITSAPKAPTAHPVEAPSQLREPVNGPPFRSSEVNASASESEEQAESGIATSKQAIALDIANHPQSELVLMLASLLGKITASNDSLHTGPNALMPPRSGTPLLAFHARNIPSISIQAYLARILKYCPMSSDIFLSLLVYFDRMSKLRTETPLGKDDDPASAADPHPANRAFTSTRQVMDVEGADAHPFSVDSFNVHRLVITGIVVASKFCSDVFYTNSRYAKVGGLPLSELNHLEFQFLLMNDFRLMIPLDELQRYGDQLLHFWLKEKATAAVSGPPETVTASSV